MKKYLVLDTETTNDIESPLTYDVGWAIFDKEGKVIKTASYVVKEIFYNDFLMQFAYFRDKIPTYKLEILNGLRIPLSLGTIKSSLASDCRVYGIEAIIAHNAKFDYNALNGTLRYLTDSRCRYFFPFGIKIFDSLRMAREIFSEDSDYISYCQKNDFLTEKLRQPKMTAEVLFRYLRKDDTFSEEHTALADTLIEKDIFLECKKRGAVNCNLFDRQFIEIFNGKESYFVEKRCNVLDAKSFSEDEIPLGKWILYKDGTFCKKGAELKVA